MTDSGFTVISSVAGAGPAAENVLKAMYAFHDFLANLHGEDPGEIVIMKKADLVTAPVTPINWWAGKGQAFTCHRGPAMRWFKQPDGAAYKTTSDDGEMTVTKVVTDADSTWLRVWATPEIWVLAQEAKP